MKFDKIKNLISEWSENDKLINKLNKDNFFLAIGHTYDTMDGLEVTYDAINNYYSEKLIDILLKRNIEIQSIIEHYE